MLRLIIVLFLVFEIPIISNAAGIYDNSLMDVDKKKKEKLENIKTNEMHLLNDNIDKTTSEYNIELLSILKKNTMIQIIQDKPLSYQKYYLTDAGRSNFIQVISNEEIDAQILLETEMVWGEVKDDLNYINILLNKIDRWTKDFLDEYFDENMDTNLILVTDINNIRQPKNKRNLYKNPDILSSIIYQNDTHRKYQDDYKTSSSYNDELNSAYGSDETKNGGEQNILSIIYLWKMYSDTIIAVLSIAILWLGIASLMKFLTRTS